LIARNHDLKRFYLPHLSGKQKEEFLTEFDQFWNQVIVHFPEGHFFWRNSVSSKMQEWERSLGYFINILFSLYTLDKSEDFKIIFICSSWQEERIIGQCGSLFGWNVIYAKKNYSSVLNRIRQEMKNYYLFLRKCFICLKRKKPNKTIAVPLLDAENQKSTLIISLFYANSFKDTGYIDPFFSNLHEYIQRSGKLCVYFNDCLENYDSDIVQNIKKSQDLKIITPYSLLGYRDLLRILFRVLFRRIKFPYTTFKGIDFSNLLGWHARRFDDYWNINSEIYYEALSKLCQSNDFSRFLLLFEGNVFERACIQAIRKHSKSPIEAYAHAVIFESNLKIRMTDKERMVKPEPDHYISTGATIKDLLIKIGRREENKIIPACSLRFIPQLKTNQATHQSRNILLALDGMCSTVSVLEWMIENQNLVKDYNIVMRTHPNVPMSMIMKQCLKSLPSNFTISKNNLDVDIEKSLCVLYRHTSIGIQALLNGVPAIHLAIDSPLSADPIEGIDSAKWSVYTPTDLDNALNKLSAFSEEQRKELIESNGNRLKDYFHLPTEDRIMRFIKDK